MVSTLALRTFRPPVTCGASSPKSVGELLQACRPRSCEAHTQEGPLWGNSAYSGPDRRQVEDEAGQLGRGVQRRGVFEDLDLGAGAVDVGDLVLLVEQP